MQNSKAATEYECKVVIPRLFWFAAPLAFKNTTLSTPHLPTMYSQPFIGFSWCQYCISNQCLSISYDDCYVNRIHCKVKAKHTSVGVCGVYYGLDVPLPPSGCPFFFSKSLDHSTTTGVGAVAPTLGITDVKHVLTISSYSYSSYYSYYYSSSYYYYSSSSSYYY